MNKKLRTNRKIRGGNPRGDRSRSPTPYMSRSRSRSRSRSGSRRSRSPSMSPIRGRVNIRNLPSDLTSGINWLLGRENLPDSGPNLRFNLGVVSNIVEGSKAATITALKTIWYIIKDASTSTLNMLTSFEKAQTLLNIGKYIILYAKIFIAYLPTESLPVGSTRGPGRFKPAPVNYEATIERYRQNIQQIETQVKELEEKFGRVHKSDLVSKKYQQLNDTLTSLIEDMNTYMDQNCSIIFASDRGALRRRALNTNSKVNVPLLVKTIYEPLVNSRRSSKKKKKVKKKKKKKTSKK